MRQSRPGRMASELAWQAIGGSEDRDALVVELYTYIGRHGIQDAVVRAAEIPPQLAEHMHLERPLPRRPRIVALDVYGTLLASSLGEVGADQASLAQARLAQPRLAHASEDSPPGLAEALGRLIAEEHRRLRAQGIPWPEVDSIGIFARAIGNGSDQPVGRAEAARACVRWECQVNPAMAMPGAAAFLDWCLEAGIGLGIVSNAQFYTPLFLEAAFDRPLLNSHFHADYMLWSYQFARAKPDVWLYQGLAARLKTAGIRPEEVLFVGNDALNDCAAAAEAGFMTCLFAGDRRSLRLRQDEARVRAKPPTTTVQAWDALPRLWPQ